MNMLENASSFAISLTDLIDPLVALGSLLIPLVTYLFLDSYKESKANKKIWAKWIKCLRQSKGVDSCMKTFDNLIGWRYQSTLSLKGFIYFSLIWVFTLLLFALGLLYKSKSLVTPSVMFLMLFVNIALAYHNKKLDLSENVDFQEVYKKQTNKEHYTNIAAFSLNAYGLYYTYLQKESWIFIMWMFGFLFGLLSYFSSKMNSYMILPKVKEALDKQYKQQYPIVETDNPCINGKLETVFDEKFLVLNCAGCKICYPLEAINYLKIKK